MSKTTETVAVLNGKEIRIRTIHNQEIQVLSYYYNQQDVCKALGVADVLDVSDMRSWEYAYPYIKGGKESIYITDTVLFRLIKPVTGIPDDTSNSTYKQTILIIELLRMNFVSREY